MIKSKQQILVTGASGQLGQEFQVLAKKNPSVDFLFTTHCELPIENEQYVKVFFQKNKIDVCINCAAYTAVDKAETDKENAFLINATAVEALAKCCAHFNTQLIHISTDYVFDGSANQPYQESDNVHPVSVYGESKLLGEKLALQHNPNTIIIRTSWLYSAFGNNFVKTMVRLMNEKNSLAIVNDQFGCPTYAADLAETICLLIAEKKTSSNKIYHFCNERVTTWYEFASAIKGLIKSACELAPITTAEYPTAAKRPAYSVLNTALIKHDLQIEIPQWKGSLQKCITRLLAH